MNAPNVWVHQAAPPTLDAPPPAPWGGDIRVPQEREPLPEEDHPAIEEPWSGSGQPIREPSDARSVWRLQ